MALCSICGLREATGYLISADVVTEMPASPPEPSVEFQETRDALEPNACEPCLVARIPAALRDLTETDARERAVRIADLPLGTSSTALTELVLEILRVSTETTAEPARVVAAIIAVLELLCRPAERTYANAALIRHLVDTDAAWRRVNRNRARWQCLPESLQDLLMRLGAVTEAFEAPALAEQAGLTPEALLARARALAFTPPAT